MKVWHHRFRTPSTSLVRRPSETPAPTGSVLLSEVWVPALQGCLLVLCPPALGGNCFPLWGSVIPECPLLPFQSSCTCLTHPLYWIFLLKTWCGSVFLTGSGWYHSWCSCLAAALFGQILVLLVPSPTPHCSISGWLCLSDCKVSAVHPCSNQVTPAYRASTMC